MPIEPTIPDNVRRAEHGSPAHLNGASTAGHIPGHGTARHEHSTARFDAAPPQSQPESREASLNHHDHAQPASLTERDLDALEHNGALFVSTCHADDDADGYDLGYHWRFEQAAHNFARALQSHAG